MEFYKIERGNSDEEQEQEQEQEEDRDELMRDAEFEGKPSYYSSSSSLYSANNHQRPCFGTSFDVWGEDISRSSSYYHGAAATRRIQELDLMDSNSIPPLAESARSAADQSDQLVGSSSDAGGGGGSSFCTVEKEHMFHKVVTPSDVGKLNRLVIPKQHAEKYFPLDDEQMKGLLLNFEDRNGKEWRFRYSYWNSSQSYVMTKGWSRFVKDKKLDAGDIVSFDRGIGESGRKDRLFIDWRHRTLPPHDHHIINAPPPGMQWGRLIYPMMPPPSNPMLRRPDYVSLSHHHHRQNLQNQWIDCSGIHGYGRAMNNLGQFGPAAQEMGGLIRARVINPVPAMRNDAAALAPKRLRLFGVNMDCCSSSSSTPQEEYSSESESLVVLPSVPLRFATAATEFAPSSVGVPQLPQSRRHYDGSIPMPNLPSEPQGSVYHRYDDRDMI